MNPINCRSQQQRSGTTQRQAEANAKKEGTFCSFSDVERACHRFLMERDLQYRNYRLAMEADKASPTKRFGGC